MKYILNITRGLYFINLLIFILRNKILKEIIYWNENIIIFIK